MIILASTSPRRIEMLKRIGLEFVSVSPKCEESEYKGDRPSDYCMHLSSAKAKSIEIENDDDIVIAADTVVAINDKVLGKPKSEKEAFEMLRMLSGKEHKVYTGYTIRTKKKSYTSVCRTKVTFRALSDKKIDDYIKTGESMDKAGAYGIQGVGCLLVESIDGDYDNVVGLPISSVCSELYKHFSFDVFKERKA